jgi:subtilisin family serine protease
MATKYLVLRTDMPAPEPESFEYSSPSFWRQFAARKLDIESIDGHETDEGSLRRDRKNIAVMDAEVALALIAPKSQKSAAVSSLKLVGTDLMPDGLVAVGAHTTPFTGQGVTLAILDTGIDETHGAFQGKTIVKKNFTGEGANDQDVSDKEGHGTHCAATICGAQTNHVRVGVAPGVVKLCVGKVLGKSGGTLEMLVKGLIWAVVEQNASIVSMSLGYDLAGNTKRMIAKGVDPALAAQAAMRQHGDIIKVIGTLRAFLESRLPHVVFVAATGNESKRPAYVLDAGLPAAELFSVGAVGPTGGKWDVAPFSNGRAQVVAPGVDVFSAAPGGGWATMSGTSMATPHVAGVAALWTEKLRNDGKLFVPESVRSNIRSTAVRQPLLSNDYIAIGAGLVQAPQS